MTEPVDFVVVGAGSAGCVVAARLSEELRTRVLLVEAGPDLRPASRPASVDAASFLEAVAEPGLTWPALTVTRSSGQAASVYTRGRGVGGSSAVNAMVALPGEPGDYQRWAELGALGWSWAEVAPWFVRTELTLTPVRPAELGPIAGALRRARPAETVLARLTRDRAGRRVSAADAYLEPARARPNLAIRTGVLVDRVRITAGRAVGVELAGGGFVPARHVVVAAGAIHTPAILLRSGVDRAGLGEGLKDHAAVPIVLRYRPGYGVPADALVVGAVARFSSGAVPADLQVLPMEHLGPDSPGLAMVMTALMQVHSTGTVRLRSDDPAQDPVVDFRMLSDERDLHRLRRGAELTLELLAEPGFREIVEPIEPDLSDAGLLSGLGDYVHAAGTCRMGRPDDGDAVVDPDGAVIGTSHLFVADASVFPDLPRANTHLPVVMVAERLSARWKLLRS